VSRQSVTLALLAACVGLLALGFALLGRSGQGSVSYTPAGEQAQPPCPPAVDLEYVENESPTERRSVAEAEPAAPLRGAAVSADPFPRAAGRLSIRAVDARTGAPVACVRVRVATQARIADRQCSQGSDEILLTLTPGRYSLVAFARGYEPLELSGLEVAAGQTLAPDSVRMCPASARIVGFVSGDLRPERLLQAELSGEGRSPCPQCAHGEALPQPCPSCGYALGYSRLPISAEGRFTFGGLASGNYALRLIDAQDRTIGEPQTLELREADVRRVELEAEFLRVVEVDFLDTDGASLAAEWAARLHPSADDELALEIVVEGGPAPSDLSCTFRSGERTVASCVLVPPEPPGAPLRGGVSIGFGSREMRSGRLGRKTVDDRPRAPSEALRPAVPAPLIQPTPLASAVGDDGLARFEPLPAIELLLEISCGPFIVRVAIPSGTGTTRVRARLSNTSERSAGTYRAYRG